MTNPQLFSPFLQLSVLLCMKYIYIPKIKTTALAIVLLNLYKNYLLNFLLKNGGISALSTFIFESSLAVLSIFIGCD